MQSFQIKNAGIVKHVAYENGAIRDANGKLIAFYSSSERQLWIDGFALTFCAQDIGEAMEIVGRRYGQDLRD